MTLMTIKEVSRETGLSEGTLRKWVFQRRIPTVRLGRSVRIRSEDIEDLVRRGYTPALTGKQS